MTFKTRFKTTIRQLVAVICLFSGITAVLAGDKVFVSPLEDFYFVAQPSEHNYYVIEGQAVLLPCTGSAPDTAADWVRINHLNPNPTSLVSLRVDDNGHQQTPGAFGPGPRTISDFESVQELKRSRNTNLPQTTRRGQLSSPSLNARDLKPVVNIPHTATTMDRKQQYSVGSDGPVVLRNGSLLILDSKPVDSGWYQCIISSNQQSLFSNIIKISIQPYLPVNSPPSNLTAVEGSSIALNCPAQPHLPASYTWTKNTMNLPQSHSLSFQTYGILQLQNITERDSGRYQCQTTWQQTEVISTTTTSIQVISKDVGASQSDQINWINIPQDTIVLADNTVIIHCLATISNSFVNYSWSRKDGKPICRETCTFEVISGNLYLYNLTLSDAGSYVCTVSGGAQSSEKSAQLSVYSLPQSEVNHNEVNATLGRNVKTITCITTGVPLPSLAWYKDGVKVEEEGRIATQELKLNEKRYLELRIRHFSLEHRGNYQCLAENVVGTAVQTVNVNLPSGEYNVGPQNVSVSIVTADSVAVKWSTKNQPQSSKYLVLCQNDTSFFKSIREHCPKHWCTVTLNSLAYYANYSITVQSFPPKEKESLESKPVHIRTEECVLPGPVHSQHRKSSTIVLGARSALIMWPYLPHSQTCGRILYYKLLYGREKLTDSIEVRATPDDAQNKFIFTKLENLVPDSLYVFQVLAATRKGLGHKDDFEAKSFITEVAPSSECDPDSNQFTVQADFVDDALKITWEVNLHPPNLSFSVQLFNMEEDVIHTTGLTTGKIKLIDNLDMSQMYGVRVTAYFNGEKSCLHSTTAVYPDSSTDEISPEITLVKAEGPNSLRVEWNYQPDWFADQPVEYYSVRYALEDGTSQFVNSTHTEAVITGLRTYTKYDVTVRAVFGSEGVNVTRTESPFSKGVIHRTGTAAPSSAPIVMDPTYNLHYIFVGWRQPIESNGRITSYVIDYDNNTFYKNSSDAFLNITCAKPGIIHSVKVAAVNKHGEGMFSQPTYLYPPHNFKSSCPLDYIGSNSTTQTANTLPHTDDNAVVLSVILGCSIIIFVILLAVLMICCCCCTRKFDRIKCSWCKRSANNLKKCNTKQNGSRMYTNNRDSGIYLSQDTPQNGLLLKPVNKQPTSNGSLSNGHVTKPLLSGLDEVKQNGYHQTLTNGHGVNGLIHMNGIHQKSSVSLKRSKSATLQRQADTMISILFNKEKGKQVKQQHERRHENGYLLSVPIPRHTYDYLSSSKTTSELDSDPIDAGSSLSSSRTCSQHQSSPSTSNSKSTENICENDPLLDTPLPPPNGIVRFPRHHVTETRANHKRPPAPRPLNGSASPNTSDYSSESPNASDEKLFAGEFHASPPSSSQLVDEMTSLWSDKYGDFRIDV